MNDRERLVETAIEITPLLQSARQENAEQSIMRWGNDGWIPVPSAWQPASDPDDEWAETELIPEPV